MHLMQYNGIKFEVEEDNLLRSKFGFRDSRMDMGFTKKDNWPFLIVDSSSEIIDSAVVQGKDGIIEYFAEQGLIADNRNHSAYEKQGLEFVDFTAIPMFQLLASPLKGNIQFYFSSKHFRYASVSYEASKILMRYIWKINSAVYSYIAGRRFRKENRDKVKNR